MHFHVNREVKNPPPPPLLFAGFWGEVEADAIDAVALAGGGLGGVLEDVTKVGAARFAEDFDAVHSVGEVFFVFDRLLVGGEEAGPAAPGVEFGT